MRWDLAWHKITRLPSLLLNELQFNTSYTPSVHAEGKTHWNSEDGCLEVGMPGGNVYLQLGMENYLPRQVINNTGSDMTNGQLVYISSGSGNNAYVTLADATSEDASASTIAMLTEDIDDGQRGWATTFGLVRDVNTDGIDAGTQLYLSTTAGGYTATAPAHPYYKVPIGQVFRKHGSEGIILVRINRPIMTKCIAGGGDPTYDDLQVSISNIRVPTSNAPTERLYAGGIGSGVTFPFLGFALNNYVYFDIQSSRSMKLSSVMDSHIHYTTPSDGTGKKFK